MQSLFRLALSALMTLAWVTVGSAQDEKPDEIIARVLRDWKEKQNRIQSIRVEASGTEFHPKGRFDDSCMIEEESRAHLRELGHVPPEDVTHPLTAKFVLDFDKNRARKDLDHMVMWINACRFRQRRTSHRFDGKQIRVYQPRVDNSDSRLKFQPDVTLQVRQFGDGFFGNEDHPLFWGCGIVWNSAIDLETLMPQPGSRRYLFKGFAETQGRRCVVLRSQNLGSGSELYYEFWVDFEHQSSVLRSQIISQGRVNQQIDAQWQQLNAVWFPMHWRYSFYWPQPNRSKLGHSIEMNVNRVVFNPEIEASDFDVKLEAGMIVTDVGTSTDGVLGVDGKTLLPLSELDSVSRQIVMRRVLLWSAAVVAIIVTLWYVRRRWIARSSRPVH